MKKIFSWFTVIFQTIMVITDPGLIMAQPPQLTGDIKQVQCHLKSGEAMLEYILTDTSVRVNAITRESTMFVIQSVDHLFWYSLKTFQNKLKSAEPKDFLVPGEILYLFLVKPVQSMIEGRHRLIIIPGGRLSGLPFEAFVKNDSNSSSAKGGKLHYLILDHEVVYQSSREFRDESVPSTERKKPVSSIDDQVAFLGFAPSLKYKDGVSGLHDSKTEIDAIGALFRQYGLSSSLVYDKQSDKDNFIETACMGKIVHLATHHLPDDPGSGSGGFLFPELDAGGDMNLFSKGILTVEEFTALKLEADLIVLNACSSGIERIQSGVTGNPLPQRLLRAGARNILSTLWNVTDDLAAHFMLDFYRSWLSGKTYSEALREVKLQWISCSSTSIPTIWAPYVLTGE